MAGRSDDDDMASLSASGRGGVDWLSAELLSGAGEWAAGVSNEPESKLGGVRTGVDGIDGNTESGVVGVDRMEERSSRCLSSSSISS